MLIPKSHLIRQKILLFLSEERKKIDQKENNIYLCSFTITEISNRLKIARSLIDEQVDFLYNTEEIEVLHDSKNENKIFITAKGFSVVASKDIINNGKLINSQLFNNYSSGFFQIVTGIIALYSIYINFTNIDSLKIENQQILKELQSLKAQMPTNGKIEIKGLKNNKIGEDSLNLK